MANRTKATLLSDKPIFDEDSDELHVGPFADAIAKAITDMTSTEAMVIGVEGKWGAGKSSAIELACRRIVRNVLAKMPDLRLKDIQKRSWPDVQAEWSHREKDRPLHLVRFNPWIFSGQENLVKAFFNEVGTAIGHSDNKVRKVVARMRDILPAVGAVAGGVAVGALTHGLGAPGGTTGGKNLGDSAKALFPPDKSLEQLKRELASALLEADKRILSL
jgi:predicted KAP-like P-loop ATPase